MSAMRVLVVAVQPPAGLRAELQRHRIELVVMTNSETAIEEFELGSYGAVILLPSEPVVAGEFLDFLRRKHATPVVILAGDATEDQIEHLYTLGADVVVSGGTSVRMVVALVRAQIRRTGADIKNTLIVGDLTFDVPNRRLTVNDKTVRLGPTEYALLEYLMRRVDQACSRDQILDAVWIGRTVEIRTIDVQMRRIRAALEAAGSKAVFTSIRGHGYRLEKHVAVATAA